MDNEVKVNGLIKKIATENCERSFREFFDYYYSQLFGLAFYYTKSQTLAEEVVSDVFLKVWKQRESIEEIKNIRAYLFVAIKRQSLNYTRDIKSFPLYINDLKHTIKIEPHTPENLLFTQEMLSTVSQTIQSLPEKCKLVYILVKEEKLKYKEVADLLNISEKTVEMHVGNAIKKIRKVLDQYEKDPPPSKSKIKATLICMIGLLYAIS